MTQTQQRAGENNGVTNMVELIGDIARALVDLPDSVAVESFGEEDSTVIRLRVAPTDIGKVIGKQGRTARSMRTTTLRRCRGSGRSSGSTDVTRAPPAMPRSRGSTSA